MNYVDSIQLFIILLVNLKINNLVIQNHYF
jgi:hypothetical protein